MRVNLGTTMHVCLLATVACLSPATWAADKEPTYLLDPFAQATAGLAQCPAAKPPLLTEREMRLQAHERAERGTSCCLAGTCECGGAYRRDPEINARVVAAIQSNNAFRNTSIWVTTARKFVTLRGCVATASEKKAIERLAKRQADVAIVWNEIEIRPVTGHRDRAN